MSEVASAYVTLIPSARGFGPKTEQALGDELGQVGDRQGKKMGTRMSGTLGKFLSRGAIGAGAAAGGLIGAALVKGFRRLDAIDQATAKLTGLGNSAKTVDTIMDNALSAVTGTAFGLDEAATIAAGAVASGVKPGKQLTKTLTLVADAATIAGVPLNEMGAIFNKVAASGKIQGDVIAQLGDKGIPILQLLGKQIGKTPAQVAELASKGKIDFATFQKAMQTGLGGAAQKSGKTFSGALKNMGAALGRLGASAEGGIFKRLPNGFGAITTALDSLGPTAKKFGEATGRAIDIVVGKVQGLRDKLGGLDFSKLDGKKFGKSLVTGLGTAINSLGSLAGKITTQLKRVAAKVDWVGLGLSAGQFAAEFSVGLAAGLINALTDGKTWSAIRKHKGEILEAVLGAVLFVFAAPEAIVGKLATIFAKIPFAGGLIAGITRSINAAGGRLFRGPIVTFFRTLGTSFADGFRGFGSGIFGRIAGIFRGIGPAIERAGNALTNRLGSLGIDIGNAVSKGIRSGLSKVAGLFKTVYTGAVGYLGRMLSYIGSLPGRISSLFSGVWSGIAAGLLTAINAVLNLPLVIPKFTIPFVGTVGGQTLIPRLASGGIVDRPTLALIGEAGPEAVVPLSGSNGKRAASLAHGSGSGGGLTRADLDYLANRIASLMGLATDGAISDQLAFAGTMGRMNR